MAAMKTMERGVNLSSEKPSGGAVTGRTPKNENYNGIGGQ